MKVVCSSCGTQYTIADEKVPPHGARVRCRKCQTVFAIPGQGPAAAPRVQGQGVAPAYPALAAAPVAPEPAAPEPPTPVPLPTIPPAHDASQAGADQPVSHEAATAARAAVSPASLPDLPFPPAERPSPLGAAEPAILPAPTAAPTASPAPAPAQKSADVSIPQATGAGATAATAIADASSPSLRGMTSSPIPEGLPPEARARHERARRLARVLASDIAIYNKEKRERGLREGNLVAVLGYEIKKSWEVYKERVTPDLANSTPYFRDALNEMLAEGKKVF
jgi:predicted Zn finger-like uncharacterized protein